MHRRTQTRVAALLLTLLLTFGSGPVFVHASLLAAEAVVLADVGGHHGANGCDRCDDGHECASDTGTCLSQCASAAQGLPPGEAIASRADARAIFDAVGLIPVGCANSPEHRPPKLLGAIEA